MTHFFISTFDAHEAYSSHLSRFQCSYITLFVVWWVTKTSTWRRVPRCKTCSILLCATLTEQINNTVFLNFYESYIVTVRRARQLLRCIVRVASCELLFAQTEERHLRLSTPSNIMVMHVNKPVHGAGKISFLLGIEVILRPWMYCFLQEKAA